MIQESQTAKTMRGTLRATIQSRPSPYRRKSTTTSVYWYMETKGTAMQLTGGKEYSSIDKGCNNGFVEFVFPDGSSWTSEEPWLLQDGSATKDLSKKPASHASKKTTGRVFKRPAAAEDSDQAASCA